MAHLIIKNIGPINEVEFDLYKINIFMGPQSSGKSTIAKIVSYCAWLEKRVSLEQSFVKYKDDKFVERLISFHKMEGYIRDRMFIRWYIKVWELLRILN